MAKHCENIDRDRKLGSFWASQFIIMARQHGNSQINAQEKRSSAAIAHDPDGRPMVLPDITLFKNGYIEHHEIKHKIPTKYHSYGLEVYRFNSLLWYAQQTGENVMYTIHDYRASGRNNRENNIDDWVTANIRNLYETWRHQSYGFSWVNNRKIKVPIYYWAISLWSPLKEYWSIKGQSVGSSGSHQRNLF